MHVASQLYYETPGEVTEEFDPQEIVDSVSQGLGILFNEPNNEEQSGSWLACLDGTLSTSEEVFIFWPFSY